MTQRADQNPTMSLECRSTVWSASARCDDTTIVARALAYTRACVRVHRVRVLRARWENIGKIR